MTRLSAREIGGTSGPFGLGLQVVRPEAVPDGSVVTVLRVPPEMAGMRLDRFVQSQLKRTSRTRAQAILDRGAYTPDAKPLRSNRRVHAEQLILLWRAPWDEQTPDVTLEVLYEDDDLVAIDKPSGIPVHPTARYHKSTVIKVLEEARQGERLFLAHRIDRETSGVLLLTRNAESDRAVKHQFGARDTVDKAYLAIVWGWPDQDHFRNERPLELDTDSRYKVKMRVAAPGEGMASATGFEVLERRVRSSDERRYALLRCALETGRQHQIRLHLASLGLPIVGDKLYGPDEALFARGADRELTPEDLVLLELERHALHATELVIDHPRTGARTKITSPLPADLQAFWDGLEPA